MNTNAHAVPGFSGAGYGHPPTTKRGVFFVSILNAIIQGLIQGLTEFLPISSSGHLSLFQYFTGQNSESSVMFSVMLHFGTLVAVFIAFWKTIRELIVEVFRMVQELFTRKRRTAGREMPPQRRMILMLFISLLPLLFSVLFKHFFEGVASDNDIILEGIGFLITAVLLTLSDKVVKGRKKAATMQVRDAVAIGVAQGIAPMSGISRSGSTISIGMLMGLDRSYAVAFSFIMGIPAVIGANILELVDVASGDVTVEWVPVIIGVIVAAVSGFFAIKMVHYFVKTDRFKYFAWYTLALGIVCIVIGIIELFFNRPVQQLISGMFA